VIARAREVRYRPVLQLDGLPASPAGRRPRRGLSGLGPGRSRARRSECAAIDLDMAEFGSAGCRRGAAVSVQRFFSHLRRGGTLRGRPSGPCGQARSQPVRLGRLADPAPATPQDTGQTIAAPPVDVADRLTF
jgi:hypothetical protein